VCNVCGMLFVHGLAEDAQRHAAVCQDYVQGVAFHATGKQQLRVLRKWPIQKQQQSEKVVLQATIIEVRVVLAKRMRTESLALRFENCLTLIGF
jgi:zinc-finger of acetyl-transferase ESCO